MRGVVDAYLTSSLLRASHMCDLVVCMNMCLRYSSIVLVLMNRDELEVVLDVEENKSQQVEEERDFSRSRQQRLGTAKSTASPVSQTQGVALDFPLNPL